MKETTIAAIATPPGEGGVSVIRVSGEDAILISDRIFKGIKSLSAAESHTLSYGKIVYQDKVLDEVLASVFRAPRSFTGENVVEFNCHGGSFVTRSVLSALLNSGATLATPGEFTKRAFLNGKLDLSQAEAVIDLISAESEGAVSLSVNQLDGKLSAPISSVRDKIVYLAAGLDAMADFPDEDIEETPHNQVKKDLTEAISLLEELESHADQGRMIRSGINTVIVGKPNVGKSSLLNALSGTERALVTQEAGTTRDVIEERVRFGNVCLNLYDTAGIRDKAGAIEEMGIKKAKEYVEKADLIFYVLDMSRPADREDTDILSLLKDKKVIALLNKTDLPQVADASFIPENIHKVYISAKEKEGISSLSKTVEELFSLGEIMDKQDATVINLRHKKAVISARESLERALFALESSMPLDLLSVDLREAIESLGTITGQTVSEEIVDQIFSRFCLGK